MAKHFKQDVTESTAVMEARKQAPVQRIHTSAPDLPYGQAASYRASYSGAALTDEYYLDDMPARGGIYSFLRGIILLLAWAFRLAALAVMLLVLANVLYLPVFRTQLTWITDLVTSYLPWHSFGLLAVNTPFGGVFRGDLAIISVLLFVVDWLLCRLRASLR